MCPFHVIGRVARLGGVPGAGVGQARTPPAAP